MTDDAGFIERYQGLSHQELYQQLQQGSPDQLEALAGVWRTVEDALGGLVSALSRDLAVLQPSWTGPASREYRRRLELIVDWARGQVEQAAMLRTGLAVLARSLDTAQHQAQPAPGQSPAWSFDGVVGAALGHTATPAAQAQAHDQLVALVAGLAEEYALAVRQFWSVPQSPAPADLPATAIAPPAPTGPVVIAGLGATQLAALAQPAGAASGPSAHPMTLSATTAPNLPPALGGAGSALAGVSGSLTRPGVRTGGSDTTTVDAGQLANQAPPPVIGAVGGVARPVDTAPAAASGFPFELTTAAWSTREHLVWTTEDDPPPAVIGDVATPA